MLSQIYRCPLVPLAACPDGAPRAADGAVMVPRDSPRLAEDSPLPEAGPVGPAIDPADGEVQGAFLAAVAENCEAGCTRANPLLATW